MSEQSEPQTPFEAPSLEELTPLFPAYELEDFIAQGGMGAVYRARQISLDRTVAIKILPRIFGEDEQFRKAFEAEAKAMARLNHPNLIAVYDFGDIDGMLFIIMEFVLGKALYYSSYNKVIDPAVALGLVSTISRGLGHAHRAGIIHRDIKPANILLDANANPKIGDFGLARPLDRENRTGVILGTPGYTAPEVYTREYPVDQRSDIFSVGALLYELLCGHTPKPHSTSLKSGVDARIDAFLAKATHANPNQRYEDVEDFANDLEALVPKLSAPRFATAPAVRTTPAAPVRPLASSKPKSQAPVIVAILCIVGVIGAVALMGKREKPRTTTGETIPIPAKPDLDTQPKPEPTPSSGELLTATPVPEPEEPEPVEKPEETPLEALERLRDALVDGKRDEFPATTLQEGSSSFFLVPTSMTWHAAREFAEDHGGQLANLKTPESIEWASKELKYKLPLWVGASDSGFEGKWFWDEGDPVSSGLWAGGQPDDRTSRNADGEDFAALSTANAGIEDHPLTASFPFIIEWKNDGSRPGSLESQLARTGEAFSKKTTPIFPTGTINVGGARFLPVKRALDQGDASTLANEAGGHLAVFSNSDEAAVISKLLLEMLESDFSCWMGARRDELAPEIWHNVTGELFEFYQWLSGQPDDDPFLVLRREGNSIGADGETSAGHSTSHALIEWSVPSLQNLPKKSALSGDAGDGAATLDKIRDEVLDRHGRDYRKYRRKYDKTVEDFLEDSMTAVNNARRLPGPSKAEIVESLKEFKELNKLPPSLPAGVPQEIRDQLDEAREELDQLWEDYKPDFENAKTDYLRNLDFGVKTAAQQRQVGTGKYLTAESELVGKDEARFHKIMNGERVAGPEVDD